MTISVVNEYLSAIDERKRLEGLLKRGRGEFSGYGLELFERGLGSKIEKLTAEIELYEIQTASKAASAYYCNNSGYWSGNGLFIGQVSSRSSVINVLNGCSVTVIGLGEKNGWVRQLDVLGGTLFEKSSFKVTPDYCGVTTPDIQMIPGTVLDRPHMRLAPTFVPAPSGEVVCLAV